MTTADIIAGFDWGNLRHVEGWTTSWFEEVKGSLNVQSECATGLVAEKFNQKSVLKKDLAFWLADAADIMQQQLAIIGQFKDTIEVMKTESIADKSKLINVQEQLLHCQSNQLKNLTSAVQSTVQSTVQKEMKSYSEVVGNDKNQMSTIQVQESLKKAVKTAIQEDDRSRNLVIFGVPESDAEQIDKCVSELFVEVGEKPQFSAGRIGVSKRGADKTFCRPIKCSFTSTTSVHQILSKARQLRLSDKFKSVFICPDRSPEERAARRALVLELKEAVTNKPDYKHFIKNGKVHSEKG